MKKFDIVIDENGNYENLGGPDKKKNKNNSTPKKGKFQLNSLNDDLANSAFGGKTLSAGHSLSDAEDLFKYGSTFSIENQQENTASLALNQKFTEKLYNTAAKTGYNMIAGAVESFDYDVKGMYDMWNGVERNYQNGINKAAEHFREKGEEHKVYQNGGFEWSKPEAWMNLVGDIGHTGGLMIGQTVQTATTSAITAATFGATSPLLAVQGAKWAKIGVGMFQGFSESFLNGKETFNNTYQNLIQKGYSEEKAIEIASNAASLSYKRELTPLVILNATQASTLNKTGKLPKIAEALHFKGSSDIFENILDPVLKKAGSTGNVFGKFVEKNGAKFTKHVSEGFEETYQSLNGKIAEYDALNKYSALNGDTLDLFDEETLVSAISGFVGSVISGGVMSGVSKTLNYFQGNKQESIDDKYDNFIKNLNTRVKEDVEILKSMKEKKDLSESSLDTMLHIQDNRRIGEALALDYMKGSESAINSYIEMKKDILDKAVKGDTNTLEKVYGITSEEEIEFIKKNYKNSIEQTEKYKKNFYDEYKKSKDFTIATTVASSLGKLEHNAKELQKFEKTINKLANESPHLNSFDSDLKKYNLLKTELKAIEIYQTEEGKEGKLIDTLHKETQEKLSKRKQEIIENLEGLAEKNEIQQVRIDANIDQELLDTIALKYRNESDTLVQRDIINYNRNPKNIKKIKRERLKKEIEKNKNNKKALLLMKQNLKKKKKEDKKRKKEDKNEVSAEENLAVDKKIQKIDSSDKKKKYKAKVTEKTVNEEKKEGEDNPENIPDLFSHIKPFSEDQINNLLEEDNFFEEDNDSFQEEKYDDLFQEENDSFQEENDFLQEEDNDSLVEYLDNNEAQNEINQLFNDLDINEENEYDPTKVRTLYDSIIEVISLEKGIENTEVTSKMIKEFFKSVNQEKHPVLKDILEIYNKTDIGRKRTRILNILQELSNVEDITGETQEKEKENFEEMSSKKTEKIEAFNPETNDAITIGEEDTKIEFRGALKSVSYDENSAEKKTDLKGNKFIVFNLDHDATLEQSPYIDVKHSLDNNNLNTGEILEIEIAPSLETQKVKDYKTNEVITFAEWNKRYNSNKEYPRGEKYSELWWDNVPMIAYTKNAQGEKVGVFYIYGTQYFIDKNNTKGELEYKKLRELVKQHKKLKIEISKKEPGKIVSTDRKSLSKAYEGNTDQIELAVGTDNTFNTPNKEGTYSEPYFTINNEKTISPESSRPSFGQVYQIHEGLNKNEKVVLPVLKPLVSDNKTIIDTILILFDAKFNKDSKYRTAFLEEGINVDSPKDFGNYLNKLLYSTRVLGKENVDKKDLLKHIASSLHNKAKKLNFPSGRLQLHNHNGTIIFSQYLEGKGSKIYVLKENKETGKHEIRKYNYIGNNINNSRLRRQNNIDISIEEFIKPFLEKNKIVETNKGRISFTGFLLNFDVKGFVSDSPMITVDENGNLQETKSYQKFLKENLETTIKSYNVGTEENPKMATIVQPRIYFKIQEVQEKPVSKNPVKEIKENLEKENLEKENLEKENLEKERKVLDNKIEESKKKQEELETKELETKELEKESSIVENKEELKEEEEIKIEIFKEAETLLKEMNLLSPEIKKILNEDLKNTFNDIDVEVFKKTLFSEEFIEEELKKLKKADKISLSEFEELVTTIYSSSLEESMKNSKLGIYSTVLDQIEENNKKLKSTILKIENLKNLDTKTEKLKEYLLAASQKATTILNSKEVLYNEVEDRFRSEFNKISEIENLEEEGLIYEGEEKDYSLSAFELKGSEKVAMPLKRLLSTLQQKNKKGEDITGIFGIKKYVPITTVLSVIKTTLANIEPNPELQIEKLKDQAKTSTWLSPLIKVLEENKIETSLTNLFFSEMTLRTLDMKYVGTNKFKYEGKDGQEFISFSSRVYDTNYNNISNIIKEEIKTGLNSNTKLVTFSDEKIIIEKEKVSAFLNNFAKKIGVPKKETKTEAYKAFLNSLQNSSDEILKKFLQEFGIPITDEMLEKLKDGQYYQYGKQKGYLRFEDMFDITSTNKGIFAELFEFLVSIKEDTTINNIQHPILNLHSINNLLKIIIPNRMEDIITSSFYDNGKIINNLPIPNMVSDLVNNYKLTDSIKRKEFLEKEYNKNSIYLKMLEDYSSFREIFGINQVGNTSIKKLGEKVFGDKKITDIEEEELQLLYFTFNANTKGKTIDYIHNNEEVGVKNFQDFRIGYYGSPALSDKSSSFMLHTMLLDIKEHSLDKDLTRFADTRILKILYSQFVLPELKRIIHNYKNHEGNSDNNKYDIASKFFLQFPEINNIELGDSKVKVSELTHFNKDLENIDEFSVSLESLLTNKEFQRKAEDLIEKLIFQKAEKLTINLKSSFYNKDTKSIDYLDSSFLNTRVKNKSESELKKLKIAAIDNVVNDIFASANFNMMFTGDLADFNNIGKGKLEKYFTDASYPVHLKEGISYADFIKDGIETNLFKRNAALIAPKKKMVNSLNKEYIQVFLEDYTTFSRNIQELSSLLDDKKMSKKEKEYLEYYHKLETGVTVSEEELERLFPDSLDYENSLKKEIKKLEKKYPNASSFFYLEGSDAQEYTTAQEHLNILFDYGQITDEVYSKAMKKIKVQQEFLNKKENEEKPIPEELMIDSQDLKLIFQPIKPIHTGHYNDTTYGRMRMMYIKSSSYPLLPQATQGLELNNLRIKLEELENSNSKPEKITLSTGEVIVRNSIGVRASYQTANKLGGKDNAIKAFTSENKFNQSATLEDFQNASIMLSRNNFGIQQDVPTKFTKKKFDVIAATQMLKLMFGNGVKDIKGFDFTPFVIDSLIEEFNKEADFTKGDTLDKYHNFIWSKIASLKKEKFLKELGLENSFNTKNIKNPVLYARNINKILKEELDDIQSKEAIKMVVNTAVITKEEALILPLSVEQIDLFDKYIEKGEENLTKNELNNLISALNVKTLSEVEGLDFRNAKFKIPIWMSSKSDKIESKIQSLFTKKLTKNKLPGNSYVVGSEAGYKIDGKYQTLDKSRIIYTDKYDFEKGELNYLEKENFAQVFLPSRFHDSKGKLIEFIYPDGSYNTEYVEKNEKTGALKLKQGVIEDSLLSLNSVRIPTSGHESMAYFEIAGFLPPEVGDLMILPSVYTVQKGLDFDVDKETTYNYHHIIKDGKIKRVTSKNSSDKLKILENEIIGIHSAVLKNSGMQSKINKSLSIDFARSQKELYSKVTKKETKDLYYPMDRGEQINNMEAGKVGQIGISMYSLNVTFNSLLQRMQNSNVSKNDQLILNEEVEEEEELEPINFTLAGFTSEGALGKLKTLDGKRDIAEVFAERQNIATDNAKELIMELFNINKETIGVDIILTLLGFDKAVINNEGKEVEISIPFWFLSQPIIKAFLKEEKQKKFSYNKNTFFPVSYSYNKSLKESFRNLSEIEISAQYLFDNIKNPNDSYDYSLSELKVLQKFLKLRSFYDSIKDEKSASNIGSKGIGKNIFEFRETKKTFNSVTEDLYLDNFNSKFKDTYESKMASVLISSLGEFWESNFELPSIFNTILNKTLSILNPDEQKSSYKKIELSQNLFKAFKKWQYSNLKTGLYTQDVKKERDRLFLDKNDKISLATYLKEYRTQKELVDNPLLNMINFTTFYPNSYNSLKINNAKQEGISENHIYNSIYFLLEEDKPLPDFNGEKYSTRKLAEDLIRASFLEGGIQEATQYIKHLPISLLEKLSIFETIKNEIKFLNRYYELNSKDILSEKESKVQLEIEDKIDEFITQYIQHNYWITNKLSYNQEMKEKGKYFQLTVVDGLVKNLLPYIYNIEEYGNISLYKRNKFETNLYEKIPVLKNKSISQYTYNKKEEVFKSNFTEITKQKPPSFTEITKMEKENLSSKKQDIKDVLGFSKTNNVHIIISNILKQDLKNKHIKESFELLLKSDFLPEISPEIKIEDLPSNVNGRYDSDTNTITLNKNLVASNDFDKISKTYLKELTHALTVKTMSQYLNRNGSLINAEKVPSYIDDIMRIFKKYRENIKKKTGLTDLELNNLYEKVLKKQKGKKFKSIEQKLDLYPASDIFEFVEVFFTEKEFQQRLEEQPFTTSKSFKKKMLEFLSKILNNFTKGKASYHVMEGIFNIMEANKKNFTNERIEEDKKLNKKYDELIGDELIQTGLFDEGYNDIDILKEEREKAVKNITNKNIKIIKGILNSDSIKITKIRNSFNIHSTAVNGNSYIEMNKLFKTITSNFKKMTLLAEKVEVKKIKVGENNYYLDISFKEKTEAIENEVLKIRKQKEMEEIFKREKEMYGIFEYKGENIIEDFTKGKNEPRFYVKGGESAYYYTPEDAVNAENVRNRKETYKDLNFKDIKC